MFLLPTTFLDWPHSPFDRLAVHEMPDQQQVLAQVVVKQAIGTQMNGCTGVGCLA